MTCRPPRSAAAVAAVTVTLALCHGVASLAEPSEHTSARLAALTGAPAHDRALAAKRTAAPSLVTIRECLPSAEPSSVNPPR